MLLKKLFRCHPRRWSLVKALCVLIALSCTAMFLLSYFLAFEPIHLMKPGEMGRPVAIPRHMESQMQKLFPINQLNILASSMVAVNRSLPDMRDKANIKYSEKLPRTTVIIVFHNEAWSTLIRTVWSVINRSPRGVVDAILLVDDKSDRTHLRKELDDYVATLPIRTEVIRSEIRRGLVHARLLGAALAMTETMTFLDAHCECTEGWLEPLLARIAEDRRVVASPVIDRISPHTFEYIRVDQPEIGAFDWKLDFRWYLVPDYEMKRRNFILTSPIRTPAMAGGIFAINRAYFYEMGSYDPEMFIWGSENIEMSLRIWQCGGSLEVLPCSRVGHIFRKEAFYEYPGGAYNVTIQNKCRVAEVWLDEWRDFFYAVEPGAVKVCESVNPKDRSGLREVLNCKSFYWYLQNIWPQGNLPLDYRYFGLIRKAEVVDKCLETIGAHNNGPVVVATCNSSKIEQLFLYTKESLLNSNGRCLYSWQAWSSPSTERCRVEDKYQHWHFDDQEDTFRLANSGKCLTYEESSNKLKLSACTSETEQQWLMQDDFSWQQQ